MFGTYIPREVKWKISVDVGKSCHRDYFAEGRCFCLHIFPCHISSIHGDVAQPLLGCYALALMFWVIC